MGKKAIISKHIVLSSYTQNYSHHPIYGMILIEGEIIQDVIILDENIPVSAIIEKYSEWNPQDCSDLYISPGLIDINVRREFENYTNLTKAAVSGGVTLICEEDGFYTDNPPNGELFCDIGKIAVVGASNVNSMEVEASKGCLAFKGYFYPPSNTVNALPHNLTEVYSNLENTGLPLFIDPTLPDPRMLYMASPMRMETLESRNDAKTSGNLNVFAGAFSNAIESEGEEEDGDCSEESPQGNIKRMSFDEENIKVHSSPRTKDRSLSGEGFNYELTFQRNLSHLVCPEITEVEEEQTPAKKAKIKKNRKSKSTIYTIFDDLDRRIRESQQSIENLSLAEQFTYHESGPTQFLIKRKKSLSLGPSDSYQSDSDSSDAGTVKTAPKSALYERRMVNRRPIPIKIEKKTNENDNKERLYIYHLANFPDHWEVSGVEKLLQGIKDNIHIHVINISSAAAINKIRQAREHLPRLSCEIPATQLYFTNNSVGDGQTIFKNTPPIRNRGNCNLLWDLLKMKAIDCITSQHAYIDPSMKSLDTGNFQKALNGICSIGFTLQAIWTMINVPVSSQTQLEHYIVRMSKWLSLHPSRILGLQDKRGSIEKGKYADLVIWAPNERVLAPEIYSEKKEMSPFLSQNLQGRIHKVYIRGKLAFDGTNFKARGKKVFRINTNKN